MPDYSSVIDPSAPRDPNVNAIAEHNPSVFGSKQIPISNIPQKGGNSYGFSNTQSLAGFGRIPEYIIDKNAPMLSDANLNASKLVGGKRRRKTHRGIRLNKSIKSRRHRRHSKSNIRRVSFSLFNRNRMTRKRPMKSKLFSKIIGGRRKHKKSRKSRKMRGGTGYSFDLGSQIAGMPVIQQYNTCNTK